MPELLRVHFKLWKTSNGIKPDIAQIAGRGTEHNTKLLARSFGIKPDFGMFIFRPIYTVDSETFDLNIVGEVISLACSGGLERMRRLGRHLPRQGILWPG